MIRRHGPDAVAVYASGQLLTEDYYLFNKLTKGLIGSNNIDTNSRLCMSSAVSGYKLALGADGPPTCYQDLDLADCVLLAGSNMAYAHPVLFRRLEAAEGGGPDRKWIVVDPRRTDTAALADLHLQIQPGSDVALFNGMLHHLIWEGLIDESYIATHTEGLRRAQAPAARLCAAPGRRPVRHRRGRSDRRRRMVRPQPGQPVAVLHGPEPVQPRHHQESGADQSAPGRRPDRPPRRRPVLADRPAQRNGRPRSGRHGHHAGRPPRHRQSATPRRGGRPLGRAAGTALRLPGLPAIALFDALKAGRVKAVWIVCTNPAHSLPDLEQARQALAQAEFVIVQDAYADTDTAACADALLPAASWGEKKARSPTPNAASAGCAAVPPPGEARADGWIAAEVGRRLERLLYPDAPSLFQDCEPAAVFAEHAALTAGRDLDLSGLSHARLERDGPQQWPFGRRGRRPGAPLPRRPLCHRQRPRAVPCHALPRRRTRSTPITPSACSPAGCATNGTA